MCVHFPSFQNRIGTESRLKNRKKKKKSHKCTARNHGKEKNIAWSALELAHLSGVLRGIQEGGDQEAFSTGFTGL